ncbi:8297_t:CDS:1 [Funneliformis geosporum]|uniref:17594_t:CDS:1 n=1 Tax=Funneliformis geosporum TaxID=1117311 RepID=A0A9W4SE32_9GLOM|nr:8297_t:CDS:1 [Funneliformis geosporum]CAI2165968.1 17594_t:CDS:1 [Funneliformis geosporum]
MHITNFDPNFSIFDKRYKIFVSEPISIDIEQLKGDQFWPKQNRSRNKLKKIFSKAFKTLKSKVFHKNRKGKESAAINEKMTSKIIYHYTSSIYEDISEFDEIDVILDFYLSL